MTADELSAARTTLSNRLLGRSLPEAVAVHLRAASDALNQEIERVEAEEEAELARGPVVYHTTGTRLRWSTLRGWLAAWTAITSRALTSQRHAQESFHLESFHLVELPDAVIEAARDDRPALNELEAIARSRSGARSSETRGRLLNAIDRAHHRRRQELPALAGEVPRG